MPILKKEKKEKKPVSTEDLLIVWRDKNLLEVKVQHEVLEVTWLENTIGPSSLFIAMSVMYREC